VNHGPAYTSSPSGDDDNSVGHGIFLQKDKPNNILSYSWTRTMPSSSVSRRVAAEVDTDLSAQVEKVEAGLVIFFRGGQVFQHERGLMGKGGQPAQIGRVVD